MPDIFENLDAIRLPAGGAIGGVAVQEMPRARRWRGKDIKSIIESAVKK